MEPPRICSQSCGAAFTMKAPKLRPAVMDSSATTAFSGSSAASTAAMPSGVTAPVGNAGRFSSLIGAGGVFDAPTASASAARESSRSSATSASVVATQSSGASTLGLPG